MSIRLQVLLPDEEMALVRRVARLRRVTVAEWVREALRRALREEPSGDPGRKLEVVREAIRHEYPVGGIDELLGEIERGQQDGLAP